MVQVNAYPKLLAGTYGYLIKLDLNLLYARDIIAIVIEDIVSTPNSTSYTEASASISALVDYLSDSACPDAAFFSTSNYLIIFFKTATYGYTANTLFGVIGNRYAQPMSLTTDYGDFPDQDFALVQLYALQAMYNNKVGKVPYRIVEQIANEEKRVRDEA